MTIIDTIDTTTTIPSEILAQARELDDLRSAIKVLEDRQKALRAGLLDFLTLEELDSVTDGTVSISRASHERKGVDRAKMEALYPKVLADVTTSVKVEQIRVKIKG